MFISDFSFINPRLITCITGVLIWMSLFIYLFSPPRGSFTKEWPRPHSLSTVSHTHTTEEKKNWSSKLFASGCSLRQRTYCTDTASVRRSLVCLLLSRSSGAVMRLFLAFVITVCDVGFIGCKVSSKCPSGQFMLKNQCVLCHPTCSECNGHELFECTTCGVGESFPTFSLRIACIIYKIVYLHRENSCDPDFLLGNNVCVDYELVK